MPMTDEEVFEKVRDVLVEALGVDEDEVSPDAKLAADLGAESIDFLDITFQLEKTFNIKIPRGEFVPDNVLNNPEFVQNGKLTEAGLAEVKSRMPHVEFGDFEQDPDVSRMMDLFTVQTIVNYVKGKIE